MALDEPTENDEIFHEKGIKFLIEKDLYEKAQPITVDFVQTPMGGGFTIKSELSKSSGCGTSCSC